MILGYTAGVFDLFHIGHLNVLRNAKAMCDRLIVAISTDELVMEYKKKHPIIPFGERCEIVRSIQFVDIVIAQENMNKYDAWKKIRFDIMFVGDDWHGNPKWENIQAQFDEIGVRIVFIPYTKGTSSTLINEILEKARSDLR